ncbi:MAG: hypothetical protein JWO51_2951 [Rhodospirillales bacterium]|nr:hypothetical protein [Rhodospirillales bacterium]
MKLIRRAEIISFKELLQEYPSYMSNANRLLPLGELMAKRWTDEDLIKRENLSPASVNKHLTAIHAMFAYGLVNEKVSANPASMVKVINASGGTTRDRSFTDDQASKILASI